MATSDNKRVAKNATALAFRMVIVTIVGLYTSRIVLQALGVDDYGIYGVIGGVVGMASFLNTSMAGATSRFITFELGQDNENKLKKIFSTALIIHFTIALGVAVLAESVGLWFVNNQMNFPPDRMFAVNILYQFTILSMMVNFTQVPYSAAIIAHEKMSIYAYLEILNVSLKLLIVYLLLIVNTDRLIFYAGLLLILSVLMALIYRLYCIRHFKECHFSWIIDKPIIKDMTKFSGIDLYGHMCVVAKNQGQPIIINIFYGVIANAGSALALTITGAISGLTTSILQAFRPQIIKQYSAGRIDLTQNIAKRAAQFTLMAYSMVAIPVIIETSALLELWLGQIPPYAVIFIRIIIINCIINVVININNACIHATGNIKNISFINGSLYLLCPVISYVWMSFGGEVFSIYIVDTVMLFAISIFGWYFIRRQIPEFNIKVYTKAILKSYLALIISLLTVTAIMYYINPLITSQFILHKELAIFLLLIICTTINFVASGVLFWIIVFNQSERNYIISRILKKQASGF